MDAIARQAPGTALRDYADAELEAAHASLVWRGGRIHAGVHRARKALRRTRATLALGGDALGPGAALLDRELKRLNDGLSALRDAQALVEALDRRIGKAGKPDTVALLKRARRAAAAARAQCAAEQAPAVAERRAVLEVLRAGLRALPWISVTEAGLRDAIARSTRRIAQAHASVQASQDDDDWHRWRRRMRRLSQQLHALDAAGWAMEAPSSFDKSLAEQLGVAQDLRLLIEHSGRSGLPKPDRTALRRYAQARLDKQRERISSVDRQMRGKPAESGPSVA